MDFTAITDTDLAQQAARLRARARRIRRGSFGAQSGRVRAHRIGAALEEASEKIEHARLLLPEAGLTFHGDEDLAPESDPRQR